MVAAVFLFLCFCVRFLTEVQTVKEATRVVERPDAGGLLLVLPVCWSSGEYDLPLSPLFTLVSH